VSGNAIGHKVRRAKKKPPTHYAPTAKTPKNQMKTIFCAYLTAPFQQGKPSNFVVKKAF
jgi:hypothetical protein